MSGEELKPCGHCGSDTAQTSEVRWNPVMTRWAVVCVHGCDAQGPPADDEAGAIAAWNKRAGAGEPDYHEAQARKICGVCGVAGFADHKAYCSESI